MSALTSSHSDPAMRRATKVSETPKRRATRAEWSMKRSAPFWKTKRPAIKEQLLKAMLSQSHSIVVCDDHDDRFMRTPSIVLVVQSQSLEAPGSNWHCHCYCIRKVRGTPGVLADASSVVVLTVIAFGKLEVVESSCPVFQATTRIRSAMPATSFPYYSHIKDTYQQRLMLIAIRPSRHNSGSRTPKYPSYPEANLLEVPNPPRRSPNRVP